MFHFFTKCNKLHCYLLHPIPPKHFLQVLIRYLDKYLSYSYKLLHYKFSLSSFGYMQILSLIFYAVTRILVEFIFLSFYSYCQIFLQKFVPFSSSPLFLPRIHLIFLTFPSIDYWVFFFYS